MFTEGMLYLSEDVDVGDDDVIVRPVVKVISRRSNRSRLCGRLRFGVRGRSRCIHLHRSPSLGSGRGRRRRCCRLQAVQMLDLVRRRVCISKLLNLGHGRLHCNEDLVLQGRVMANEFLERGPNEDSVLLLLKHALMFLRCEDVKDAGNDVRTSRQLILTSLVEAQSADSIRYGLNNLCKDEDALLSTCSLNIPR